MRRRVWMGAALIAFSLLVSVCMGQPSSEPSLRSRLAPREFSVAARPPQPALSARNASPRSVDPPEADHRVLPTTFEEAVEYMRAHGPRFPSETNDDPERLDHSQAGEATSAGPGTLSIVGFTGLGNDWDNVIAASTVWVGYPETDGIPVEVVAGALRSEPSRGFVRLQRESMKQPVMLYEPTPSGALRILSTGDGIHFLIASAARRYRLELGFPTPYSVSGDLVPLD